jgi:hypothetical protein
VSSVRTLKETKVKAGQIWLREGSKLPIRVMAVAEGWAMVRYKGCTPFAMYIKDLLKGFAR